MYKYKDFLKKYYKIILDKNVWAKSSAVNGGKPYLKTQHW